MPEGINFNPSGTFLLSGVIKEAQRIFQDTDTQNREKDSQKKLSFEYAFNKSEVMYSEPDCWGINLTGHVSWRTHEELVSVGFKDVPVTVVGLSLYYRKAIAYFRINFFTPHFTEYMLPFCLAALVSGWKIFTT